MTQPHVPLVAAILRYAATLRFRQLFFITGALFLIDILLPDLIPFADEIALGLLTLLFGAWKKRSRDDVEQPRGQLIDEKRILEKPHQQER